MLNRAEIQNFRSFEDTSIRNAQRVNVVVGRNGAGKTALLEALFLATAASPEIVVRMNARRGMDLAFQGGPATLETALWDNIFFDFDDRRVVRVTVSGTSGHNREVSVGYFDGGNTTIPLIEFNNEAILSRDTKRIVFEWKDAGGNAIQSRPFVAPEGLNLGPSQQAPFLSMFFGANHNVGVEETASRFSDISKQRKRPETTKIISGLFPEIQDLSIELLGGKPMLHATVRGVKNKIPLPYVSSGINKAVSILISIESAENSLVFIDEIEGGFHYSVLEKMWSAIMQMSKKKNSQVWASTHSRECLEALSEAAGDQLDQVALIRVDRVKGRSVVREFSGYDLRAGVEYGSEVR